MQEVNYVMDKYGLVIDHRHLMLLADLMAFKVSISLYSLDLASFALFFVLCMLARMDCLF